MELIIEKIGLKLASALLLHKGELSIKDIRSMPFFTDPNQIATVTQFLIKTFNAEIYSKQVASFPILEWEQIIRLKKTK